MLAGPLSVDDDGPPGSAADPGGFGDREEEGEERRKAGRGRDWKAEPY